MVGNRDGQGLAVMINANQPALLHELRRAVAAEFGWPGYTQLVREATSPEALSALPGRYRYNDEQFIRISRDGDALSFAYGGETPTPLHAIGGGRYVRADNDNALSFTMDGDRPTEIRFGSGGTPAGEYRRLADDELSPRERLYANQGDAALAAYREVAAKGGIVGSEAYLNLQGYRLLGQKQHEAAVQVLALVTELHPDSANAWDSLGEAQRAAGNLDAARAAYRRVLAIDPAAPVALAALKALDP